MQSPGPPPTPGAVRHLGVSLGNRPSPGPEDCAADGAGRPLARSVHPRSGSPGNSASGRMSGTPERPACRESVAPGLDCGRAPA